MNYVYGFILSLVVTLIATPLVKKFAIYIGAVDKPNHRKVHQRLMPRMGGLAIYIGFSLAYWLLFPPFLEGMGISSREALGIFLGGTIIVLVGALDDRFELSPKLKLLGQILAAAVVVFYGLRIEFINLPFQGILSFGWDWIAIAITVFWIIGITNAVNLIDGLDGLAAGVSGIATAAIMIVALFVMPNPVVALYCAILLGGIVGFLRYNFHPAKIFMGDTGALFLGFNLAALSIMGFKNVTLFAFIMPILILGVPLSDTIFAMLRRYLNKKPISVADKEHLHHCLLAMGLSHRSSVLAIYGLSVLFATAAIVFSQSYLWGAFIIVGVLLVVLQLMAELIGWVGQKKKPLLETVRRIKQITMGKEYK
ncbi:glycosyltransferase family 4 protein [Aneurinibacillus aneurinilyticus]|jgi:UDP-GlcNAc:undecaprenyl-phosphate GlcNAc-1-phosphate transferase|uniref:glycosyltransferase family 4 protein n=1 Tax=Aneurinibacillus aneurinilyticus TaxID=1391 RepID=UPI0023F61962|nr:MraY family glycosyltransferase [Aneurinibacillus aneurinilyticus]MCI1694711.1 undecaprenyl/decaprenyl-phosphate alpha-N-acetylglucosaminyl 1-phosphate transferase [Aneurinibacillus aneurinilyticus]MED0671861.1 MraY family glycosyltransferase [Aneurinibacillus aneurinilyticus]